MLLRLLFLASFFLATFVASAPLARATEPEELARQLFDQGRAHFDAGRYDEAIAAFRAAYAAKAAPDLLFNIAQAYRLKRDCPQALQFYRSYAEADPSSTRRTNVALRIEEMARCVAAGERPAATPAQSPAPAPRREEPRGPLGLSGLRLAGAATAGVGVIGLGLGAFFALRANGARNDLDDRYSGVGTPWDDAAADLDARRRRESTLAIVSSAVGGAALIGGGVLYGLGLSRERNAPAVALVPQAGGATFAAVGRF